MRSIELLAPAKTADIGIEAIKHGADAVYIGASAYGARAAASNSLNDIARLTAFAHLYKAKVYVTVNTVIYSDEMKEVQRLIWQLHDIQVDALIVQDLRLLSLDLPPIPLHASTQMDNRTVEKVQELQSLGFPQVVLARELTTTEIAKIHEACPDTLLEVFVHGALCVSLSGRCNASEALFGRSANRGACAQVCRMQFDLTAATNGQSGEAAPRLCLARGKHLLSLRDNCQIDHLGSLIAAGASSLKIEGRLKDADYVKNITAAYSEALNAVIAKHPQEYCRASSGRSTLKFTPNIYKSFNRGFVKDVSRPEANFDTPKSLGEPVSKDTVLHNGDGLCYIEKGQLVGFRLNNAAAFKPVKGVRYFRNQDTEWDNMMGKPTAERKVAVDITVDDNGITMTDEDGFTATAAFSDHFELAHTHQTENIRRQLGKLGDTIFEARSIDVRLKKNYFIPSSMLSSWRREMTASLTNDRMLYYPLQRQEHVRKSVTADKPFEETHDLSAPVMTCKHCIRRQMGLCLKDSADPRARRLHDMQLHMANGTVFHLEFDCNNCLMKLYLRK